MKWNRLLCLPTNRVAGEIFYWDMSVGSEWASEIFDILEVVVWSVDFQKAKVEVEEVNTKSRLNVQSYGQKKSGTSWN